MSSTTPLTDAINALTTYANEITGQSDTTLSDAVESLVDGYGGGGSGITRVTGSVTGSGTNIQSISCGSAPDIILTYRSDFDDITAVSDRAHTASIHYVGFFGGSYYTAASSASPTNSGLTFQPSMGTSSNPGGNNKISFNDGFLYVQSGNGQNKWSASLTYNYELFYLP